MDRPPQHILHNGDYFQVHFTTEGEVESVVRFDDNRCTRGALVEFEDLDPAVRNKIKVQACAKLVDEDAHHPLKDYEVIL